MKITIYELLGLIKEDKQPKHIKYRDEEWWWTSDIGTYFTDLKTSPDAQVSLFNRYRMDYCLDDEVEIIEEYKKIEKLNPKAHFIDDEEVLDKVNELIDKVNELEEKIDE